MRRADHPAIVGRIHESATDYEPAPEGRYRWLEVDNADQQPLFPAHGVEAGICYDERGDTFLALGVTMKAGEHEVPLVAPVTYERGLDIGEWLIDTLCRVGSATGKLQGARDRAEAIARRLSATAAEVGFNQQRELMQGRMAAKVVKILTGELHKAFLKAQTIARDEVREDVRRLVQAALLADDVKRGEALADLADFVERTLSRRTDPEPQLRAIVAALVNKALIGAR